MYTAKISVEMLTEDKEPTKDELSNVSNATIFMPGQLQQHLQWCILVIWGGIWLSLNFDINKSKLTQ